MQITTRQILKLLYILSWIIFVGVCIEAGGFIVNGIATLLLTPAGAKHFWQEVDLSTLYTYDKGYFSVITLMMSMVAVMIGSLIFSINVGSGQRDGLSTSMVSPLVSVTK